MDKPSDQEKNNKIAGDQTQPEGTQASAGGAAAVGGQGEGYSDGLPIVDSPELGGADSNDESTAEIGRPRRNASLAGTLPALFTERVDEAPRRSSAADTRQRSFRFALVAATIACAAGIGALVGSLSASGLSGRHVAAASIPKSTDTRDVLQALRTERAELSSLKASLDSANRTAGTQFAKISDRLNALERADPSAKLARIADEVERLEKRTAGAADITGSIATSPTGAGSAAQAKPAAPVLHDWIVQEVHNGRAMVENRYGALFLVGSGSVMPGLGRVQDVKRQNGAWIVVTEKGLITSHP